MTDKITLELTIEELKLIDKYVEYGEETKELFDKVKQAYPQPKMTLENEGKFEIVSYNDKCYVRMDYSYDTLWYMSKNTKDFDGNNLILITDDVTRNVLEGLWYGQVKKDEPTKPMDEVVERLTKKYQAQKLYNRLFELGYEEEDCDVIVDLVEDWLPEPQNASGSQNVDTELLVDGFNDCVRKMKEMLR
jgi:hypothetical protein